MASPNPKRKRYQTSIRSFFEIPRESEAGNGEEEVVIPGSEQSNQASEDAAVQAEEGTADPTTEEQPTTSAQAPRNHRNRSLETPGKMIMSG